MKRVHLFIQGDVIGVGFRAWTQQTAVRRHLVGWVRNADRNRVEVVAEGEKSVLETFIDECKRGPEVAWVEKVDAKWEKSPPASAEEFVGFEIRY